MARVAPRRIAEVADGGEAGLDRLPRIGEGAQRRFGGVAGHVLDQGGVSARIRFEMDVAVDQAGKDEAGREVDEDGARGRGPEPVLDRDDPAAWRVIVEGPRGGRPGRSRSRPAWTIVTGPVGAGRGAGGWAEAAAAINKMGPGTSFIARRRDIEDPPWGKLVPGTIF